LLEKHVLGHRVIAAAKLVETITPAPIAIVVCDGEEGAEARQQASEAKGSVDSGDFKAVIRRLLSAPPRRKEKAKGAAPKRDPRSSVQINAVRKDFAEHRTVAHTLDRKRLGACATLVDTLACTCP